MTSGEARLALRSERLQVEDSPEGIAQLFAERGWSDGLPIVPPTPERVEAMLAETDSIRGTRSG